MLEQGDVELVSGQNIQEIPWSVWGNVEFWRTYFWGVFMIQCCQN